MAENPADERDEGSDGFESPLSSVDARLEEIVLEAPGMEPSCPVSASRCVNGRLLYGFGE